MIAHRLDVFNRRCLRAILGISWRDHVTNEEEVMGIAGMVQLQDIVSTRRRKMADHVLRLRREDSHCIPPPSFSLFPSVSLLFLWYPVLFS